MKREEVLAITHKGHEDYRGIVYIGELNEKVNLFKEYSCYIDDISNLLKRLHVDELSNRNHKIHFYITHNTFKTFKGRENNLFSLNNFVIDIDCHDDMNEFYREYMLKTVVSVLQDKLCSKFPEWTFVHYTGRGIQIWWNFKQVSVDLLWLYNLTYEKLIAEIESIIKSVKDKNGELLFSEVQVDPTTKKDTGYFRLPETYNPKADKMTSIVEGNTTPYLFQDLVDAANDFLEAPVYSTNSNHSGNWDFMMVHNKKRITLIENVIKDRLKKKTGLNLNVNNSYGDDYVLLVYYNCAKYVSTDEKAKEMTRKLADKIGTLDKSLKSIFKHIDSDYKRNKILKFRNVTIINILNLSESEQKKYGFYGIDKWDWSLCKPNRSRDEERANRRLEKETRIITLYNSGLTQEEVAKEMGISVDTVNRKLKKYSINRKEERIRQIQMLKGEKFKQKEVAEYLNIGVRTVARYWNAA